MTEYEAFDCLQGAAIAIIKGDDLPDEVRQWVGRGLLAMCQNHTIKLNEAFRIKKVKSNDPSLHASRYAQVDFARLSMNKEDALNAVADHEKVSVEAIRSSWNLQSKRQSEFKKKMG